MNDSPDVVVPPPLLFVVALAGGLLIDGNVWTAHHMLHASQWIGVPISLAGLALIATTLALFWRFRTRPEPWQPASTLIEAGPYKVSRNPMYLGMALAAAGIAVFFESIAALILIALVVAVIDRWVVAREEAYLTRRFGKAFADYRRRVRRWL